MRNRAKCKLCGSIIESLHRHDYVTCKCGEIAVDGGLDYLKTFAKNYDNFLRIDDLGNEIVVEYKNPQPEEKPDERPADPPKEITKDELVYMLDTMIKNIENLPQHAQLQPVNHYDLISFMLVMSNILKKL